MSDTITIFNGGEAPQGVRAVANASAVATDTDQSYVMQLNGGHAQDPASSAQEKSSALAQTSQDGGEPPLGGGVHAS